ncbi:hypothetical protein CI238_10833 [Colletotrichum incanum]|uniref:Uncharacterized protein n=1 Tax=Colletotrichum incanum TaxID=1573173 RepID=A0A162MY74_COLIC|nr:hypothetical protein CI238_10833 [Colletotrichum incanum]
MLDCDCDGGSGTRQDVRTTGRRGGLDSWAQFGSGRWQARAHPRRLRDQPGLGVLSLSLSLPLPLPLSVQRGGCETRHPIPSNPIRSSPSPYQEPSRLLVARVQTGPGFALLALPFLGRTVPLGRQLVRLHGFGVVPAGGKHNLSSTQPRKPARFEIEIRRPQASFFLSTRLARLRDLDSAVGEYGQYDGVLGSSRSLRSAKGFIVDERSLIDRPPPRPAILHTQRTVRKGAPTLSHSRPNFV